VTIALVALVAFMAIALAAAIRGFWLEGRVLRRLERAHPDMIRHLDESWGPTSKLLRLFIWREEHEGMGDPALSKLIGATRLAWIGMGCSVVGGCVALKLI
jgi:hypothetical protein